DAPYRRADRCEDRARMGPCQPRGRTSRPRRGDRQIRARARREAAAAARRRQARFLPADGSRQRQGLRARLGRDLGELRARRGPPGRRRLPRETKTAASLMADETILETKGLTKEFKGFV